MNYKIFDWQLINPSDGYDYRGKVIAKDREEAFKKLHDLWGYIPIDLDELKRAPTENELWDHGIECD